MRSFARGLSDVLLGIGVLYGEYMAIRAFFQTDICHGADCQWILSGWSPVVVGTVFLVVFLPTSPLVSMIYAWPAYVLSALLRLAAGPDKRTVAG